VYAQIEHGSRKGVNTKMVTTATRIDIGPRPRGSRITRLARVERIRVVTYKRYLAEMQKVRAEARSLLAKFLGADNAEKLVDSNLDASIATLKVFDGAAGTRLYSRVVELGRSAADWGQSAADELAQQVAEHLGYLLEMAEEGRVKFTLPRAFRVRIYGMNRRYEVKSGRAKYAPIKRKKKG